MLEKILSLFGTTTAKENFLRKCESYYNARRRMETEQKLGIPSFKNPRRKLHDEIMDIVALLFTQNPKAKQLFQAPPTRREVGEAIMEFFQLRNSNRKSQQK